MPMAGVQLNQGLLNEEVELYCSNAWLIVPYRSLHPPYPVSNHRLSQFITTLPRVRIASM